MFFIRLYITKKSSEKRQIFNIGQFDDGIKVQEIAEIVRNIFPIPFEIKYGKDNKGWLGDVPKFSYKAEKLKLLGWVPKLSSREAIQKLAAELYKEIIKN